MPNRIKVPAWIVAVLVVFKAAIAFAVYLDATDMTPEAGQAMGPAGLAIFLTTAINLLAVALGAMLIERGAARTETTPGALMLLGGAAIWLWALQ